MGCVLQNHPCEDQFPVRKASMIAAFEDLSPRAQLGARSGMSFGFMAVVLAVVFQGVLSDTPDPPSWGLAVVIGTAGVGLALFVLGLRPVLRGKTARIDEQERYYREAGITLPLDEEKRAALQLDGVNARWRWSETLEGWPAQARLPENSAPFHSFELITVDEVKATLDQNWGIVSREDFERRVQELFEGLHTRMFAVVMASEQRSEMVRRLASLTGIDAAEIEGLTLPSHGLPPRLLWAWDLWRVLPMCRDAFMAKLCSEEEAWRHILEASRRVHGLFEDLAAYHRNLRIGHAFWSNELARVQERAKVLAAYERDEPPRPIRQVAWKRESPDSLHPELWAPMLPQGQAEDPDEGVPSGNGWVN